jgi:hypothetical protein
LKKLKELILENEYNILKSSKDFNFYEMYNAFNKKYFDNTLPNIQIVSVLSKNKAAYLHSKLQGGIITPVVIKISNNLLLP